MQFLTSTEREESAYEEANFNRCAVEFSYNDRSG